MDSVSPWASAAFLVASARLSGTFVPSTFMDFSLWTFSYSWVNLLAQKRNLRKKWWLPVPPSHSLRRPLLVYHLSLPLSQPPIPPPHVFLA